VDGSGCEGAIDGVERGRHGVNGVMSNNGCSHGNWLGNSSNGYPWSLSVHNGVEPVDGVSGVGDRADGTVWFHKAVLTSNDVPIPGLGVGLVVPGDRVVDAVSKVVLWMRVIWLRSDCCHSDGGGLDGHWSMDGMDGGSMMHGSRVDRGVDGVNGGMMSMDSSGDGMGGIAGRRIAVMCWGNVVSYPGWSVELGTGHCHEGSEAHNPQHFV